MAKNFKEIIDALPIERQEKIKNLTNDMLENIKLQEEIDKLKSILSKIKQECLDAEDIDPRHDPYNERAKSNHECCIQNIKHLCESGLK